MFTVTEQKAANGVKCLGMGKPKGAGKTTFYMTMPLPILDFQYDLGSITIPPGVDANQVFVQDYPDTEVVDLSAKEIKRRRENGDKVAKDLVCLLDSFKSGKDIIKLSDGGSCPKPKSILFDGGSRLDDIMIDLICAINGISSPQDMPGATGNKGAGTLRFYYDRLSRLKRLFTMVISLPCNVAMTVWEDAKHKKDIHGNILSTTVEPDLGGKLNVLGPGMFDHCLQHYFDAGRYLVRTKPTPECGTIGVRDIYNCDPVIDVTIIKDDKRPLPFERVFKKGVK